ncbi:hypothetical protein D6D17_01980 [Aureobasidium pullulans]|nr:hypothetical protein D6D17_01980 [Aureobasidium pullulans]
MSKTYSDKDTRRTKSPEFQTGKKRTHDEATRRSPAPYTPRSNMPSIEEDEKEVKTEIKPEINGRASPLFEPPASTKRDSDDEISTSHVKRSKPSHDSGPLAYGGGPVRQYVLGTPHRYSRHSAMPDLEVNSKHHRQAEDNFLFNMKQVAIPAIAPYIREDKSLSEALEWLEKNARIPATPPTRFALIGASGSGKTSVFNNIMGVPDLANSDSSGQSVTQNPQIFNHGTQNEPYAVEVLFLNARAIKNLIFKCISDLIAFVKLSGGGDTEDELEYVRQSAEAGRQVIHDLFYHKGGLPSIDDAEDFLEGKSLLSQNDETISESAVEGLYNEVVRRAESGGIDLDKRSLRFTAGNVDELRAKAARFAEREGFASIVSSIRTKLHSSLLALGIELADLPGYTDTNTHLRKTSMNYLINCPKAIFVAEMNRVTTTPELEKSLRDTIKLKGAENVILVVTSKEKVEKSKNNWTKEDTAHFDSLERELKIAKAQENGDDDQIRQDAKTKVNKIETDIFEHRMQIRDRFIVQHFHQKRFQNKKNNKKITVILVANKCQESYLLGLTNATVALEKTGIPEVQAKLCETPSRDKVQALARQISKSITKLRRISVWADGPKMPPQDAAMAVFELHARWGVDGFLVQLIKASKKYRKVLVSRFHTAWQDAALLVMDGWSSKYAPRTQGVFIRQGGRHSPKLKGEKTARLISWNEDLMTVAEDDVVTKLSGIFRTIDEIEGSLVEHIADGLEKICNGLEMLDTIGGSNLEGVFELFKEEGRSCTRDMKRGISELKGVLCSEVQKSVTDEPCDENSPIILKSTTKIFAESFEQWPPRSPGLTKERMKYIKEHITDAKGPYIKMTEEVFKRLEPLFQKWATEAKKRIEEMHSNIRDVLLMSFEGKKMSDARRQEVGPAIKVAMEKARAVLQADLDGYSADIL